MPAYSVNVKSTAEDNRPEGWADQLREVFLSRDLKVEVEGWDDDRNAFIVRGYHGTLKDSIAAVSTLAGVENVEVALVD